MFEDYKFDYHKGRVLTKFSFLKRDDRFKHDSEKISLKVDGAPGFHGSGKIFSLGQPTLIGIENIIKLFGAKKIIWLNLKEEPTIYINNVPYVVRDINNPFCNISSFRSITAKNLEILEDVLREDVVNECNTQRGFLHTFTEVKDKQLEKKITFLYDIMTNQQVVYQLKSKGYKIEYFRAPLPTEHFVSECQSLNLLEDILERYRGEDVIFFLTSSNDVKRSLFVFILIKLFYITDKKMNHILDKCAKLEEETAKTREEVNIFDNNDLNSTLTEININNKSHENPIHSLIEQDLEGFTEKLMSLESQWVGSKDEFNEILKASLKGNVRIINNLMFFIGEDAKNIVDYFIDKHSFPINLRKNIVHNYLKAICKQEDIYLKKSLLSLERYIVLLLYVKYIKNNCGSKCLDFISWINSKPFIANLFEYLRDQRHIDKALFPLNMLNMPISNKFYHGYSKTSKLTMLVEFTNKVKKVFDSRINIISFVPKKLNPGTWINLREEPCLFINDRMYVLKEIINYHSNPTFFSGITNNHLEKFEVDLKLDLIKEFESTKKIRLFKESKNDIEEVYFENYERIETTKEYLERMCDINVKVHRILITSKIALKETLFDKIQEVVTQNPENEFYVQSGGFGYRASYVAIIIDLLLGRSNNKIKEKTCIKPIHALIRILEKGEESYERVNYLYSKYFGNTFSLSSDSHLSDKELETRIKNIFLIICFASHCIVPQFPTFIDFYNTRKDVQNLFNSIDLKNNREEIFLILQNEYLEDLSLIRNRNGKVLGPMTLLKSDFFIGSVVLKQDENSNYPGNFRYIYEKGIIYAGCAMPTQKSVQSTLDAFKETLNCDMKPLWMCLREEPVIYLDGSPYALRYVTKLCENIETAGITYTTIETVEEELCKDALNELKEGYVLLHDEIVVDGVVKDVGRHVKVDKCESVSTFFSQFDLNYCRVPVTDERAPRPQIFDFFIKRFRKENDINIYVFNCQMGRGRTTTALVICYLINNPTVNSNSKFIPAKYKLIGRLMQFLPHSHASKKVLDSIIDKFEHIENIRNAIDRYSVGNYYVLKKGKEYLLRYFNLLVFANYLLFHAENSFVEFLEKHPEIQTISSEIDIVGLELI